MPVWRYSALDWLFLCPAPGGDDVTQSAQTQFVGVLFPNPLAVALKEAAAQRGQSQSDIVRLAVAREIAQVANPKRPAQPAQSNPVR